MREVEAIVTQESARISCNFEQVEKAIQDTLAEYEGAVFTEGSKAMAKKHVASLRAQKKTFQDNLLDEKKKYMAPWDEFEAQAKKLIAMYDVPIGLISGQVQAFEENRIAKRKTLIGQIYGELVPEGLRQYIPLGRIYSKKWENATTREKDIRREISSAADSTAKDIATIENMESEAVSSALDIYRENLDITDAIACINNYERQKQEILAQEQERRRREEEWRIRREERERVLAERRAAEEREAAERRAMEEREAAERRAAEALEAAARQAEEEKAAAVELAKAEAAREAIDSLIPEAGGEAALYEYRAYLSDDEKKKLEMYMDSVGIEWELV